MVDSVDPNEVFGGTTLLVAPHMDDEVLACGSLLAWLTAKERIHVLYATDGSQSPAPPFPWLGDAPPNLPAIRVQEARSALCRLGIPQDNLHFLNLPDAHLKRHLGLLRQSLAALILRLQPATVLIPFRFDRHPDHLALHRATLQALSATASKATIFEYFVYYRWQLLPGKDVRSYVRPEHLVRVEPGSKSAVKQSALECFKSQTTLFCEWQERPILTEQRVDEVSRTSEYFLRYRQDYPGTQILVRARLWIYLVHLFEPRLKVLKDRLLALPYRRTQRRVGKRA